VLLRLVTLFVAQSFDLATFSAMVARHGVAAEANPLVGGLFLTLGMPAVAMAKLLLVVLVAALAVAGWARGGRGTWALVGIVPVAIAIAAGLLGGITNTWAYLG
jgi:hypothetical protein